MSPVFCLRNEYILVKTKPLKLRCGFHNHAEKLNPEIANKHYEAFAGSRKLILEKTQGTYPFVIKRV
jgi:hypothetical protein